MRVHKLHFAREFTNEPLACGRLLGHATTNAKQVTCRRCWFRILAATAPWAPGFLDDLRGKSRWFV